MQDNRATSWPDLHQRITAAIPLHQPFTLRTDIAEYTFFRLEAEHQDPFIVGLMMPTSVIMLCITERLVPFDDQRKYFWQEWCGPFFHYSALTAFLEGCSHVEAEQRFDPDATIASPWQRISHDLLCAWQQYFLAELATYPKGWS